MRKISTHLGRALDLFNIQNKQIIHVVPLRIYVIIYLCDGYTPCDSITTEIANSIIKE